jgi:hypothetical protein
MSRNTLCSLVVSFVFLLTSQPVLLASEEISPVNRLEQLVNRAECEKGEAEFQEWLEREPTNESVRGCLGIIQFLRAFEAVGQDVYRFGIRPQINTWGVIPLPFFEVLAVNPTPQQLSYEEARAVLTRALDRFQKAELTLATCKAADFKCPINVKRAYLDFDLDGIPDSHESLFGILTNIMNRNQPRQDPGEPVFDIVFAFDTADLSWMRGYTHVLSSIINIVLAHDWREAFERTAHLVVSNPVTPYDFLKTKEGNLRFEIVDLIALIHLIRFEVTEPERMRAALQHMESVLAISRETLRLVQEETDDDREWLPSPKQKSIIIGNRVGATVVRDWIVVLNKVEPILQGKVLLPLWRDGGQNNTKGINFRKVFLESKQFDLVLWIQGTDLIPYVEEGKVVDRDSWQQVSQMFGGNFLLFAFWMN